MLIQASVVVFSNTNDYSLFYFFVGWEENNIVKDPT
jgi:hypothetical protein